MKKPVKKAAAKKAPAGRLAARAATAKKPTKVAGKPAKKASKPSVAKTPAKAVGKKAIKSAAAPSVKAKKSAPAKTKASSGKTPVSKVSSVKKVAGKTAVRKKSDSNAAQKSASRLSVVATKKLPKKIAPAKNAPAPALAKKKTANATLSAKKVGSILPVQSSEPRSSSKSEQVVSTPPVPVAPKAALPARKDLGKVAFAIVRPLTAKDQKPPVTKSSSPVPSTAPDLLENDEGANPGFFQTDEVFDETDYAQHLQLMEQADISRRARELNRPQVHPDFDGEHCIECDIQIPQARLQAGRIRCVDCQEEVENEARRNQNLVRGR